MSRSASRPAPGLASRAGARVALVCAALAFPVARASPQDAAGTVDGAVREQFVADRDARALLARIEGSARADDRAVVSLARLAADPAARAAPSESSALVRAVDALRVLDLPRARREVEGSLGAGAGVAGAFVEALVLARAGQDETAARRLLDVGGGELAAGRFSLALVSTALPGDDRELLGGVLRTALVRAGAAGRLDAVRDLCGAYAAFHPGGAARGLAMGARILRRAGADAEAAALLARREAVGAAAALERALAAWRRGDAAAARGAGRDLPPAGPYATIFDVLARAAAPPAVVPGPPFPTDDGTSDADASAWARVLTLVGAPTSAADLTTRARQRGVSCADPGFLDDALATAGAARLELAGDAAPAREALRRGLPLVVRTVRRRNDRFVEEAVVVRGFDPATDLLVADEPDPERPDVMPCAFLDKLRYAVVAARARAADLATWRDTPAGKEGARLLVELAPAARGDPAAAAAAVAARVSAGAALGADVAAVTLFHQGQHAHHGAALARDSAARVAAGALLRRSSARPPVLPVERYLRTTEATWSREEADVAVADLAAIEADEGPCAWVHVACFVVYEAARRHAEALDALARARALDPFDVRSLYFRGSLRRVLGDADGARGDFVRVLDRRPETLAAAEDLVAIHLDAGAPERALAVVTALVAADPEAAEHRRVRQLRQRTEARLVRRARTVADLVPLAASPEPDTRREVAWAAASLETPDAEALARRLLLDPDEGVRRKAAQAYQRPWLVDRLATDPALLDALAARLEADASAVVREALVIALGRADSPRAERALVARLAGAARDGDVGVRAAVAEALYGRETPAALGALVGALDDPEAVVRAGALRGLVRVTGTAYGFVADAPPEQRAPAVETFRRWVATLR